MAKSSQGFAIQVMPMGAGNLEDKRVIGSGNSEHPLRLEFVVDVMEDGEMEVKLVGVGGRTLASYLGQKSASAISIRLPSES